jgi:hypothetical protein
MSGCDKPDKGHTRLDARGLRSEDTKSQNLAQQLVGISFVIATGEDHLLLFERGEARC